MWSRAEVLLVLILLAVVINIALAIVIMVAPWARRRLACLMSGSDSDLDSNLSSKPCSDQLEMGSSVTTGVCLLPFCTSGLVTNMLGCTHTTTGGSDPVVGVATLTNSADMSRLGIALDFSTSGSFISGVWLGVTHKVNDFPTLDSGCPDMSGYFVETLNDVCPLPQTRQYCVDLQALGLHRCRSLAVAVQVQYSASACPETGDSPLNAYLENGAHFASCEAPFADLSPPACLTAVPFKKRCC
jgi:hypothetical protein